jgi:hypothetical protein
MSPRRLLPLIVAWVLLNGTHAALACTACYGQSDSSLAKGMNAGIYVLLGFVGMVLVGVSGFFVFIVRRAERMETSPNSISNPTNLPS